MKKIPIFFVVKFFAALITCASGCSSRTFVNEFDGGGEATGGGGPHAGLDHPFQNGPVQVTTLYPVDVTYRSDEDWVLLTALQGVVARHSPTQLFLYKTADPAYFPNETDKAKGLFTGSLFLLNYLTKVRNPPLQVAGNDPNADVWTIVADFKQYVTGYVLYKPILKNDLTLWRYNSRNLAVTQCGLDDGLIPMTYCQSQRARSLNLPQKHDLSAPPAYLEYISDNLSSLNRGFVVNLPPGNSSGPMDYAVMLNGLLFDYYGPPDRQVNATQVMQALDGGTAIPVFNYGPSEGAGVKEASELGDFIVPADHSHNLSLLSSTRTRPSSVTNADPKAYECNKTYVTFVVSDGDNIQNLSDTIDNMIYYGSDWRGKFPIGWTISPALYYLSPDVWNFYVNSAVKNYDEFVAGPSTIGYVNEYATVNQGAFLKQLEYTNIFMAKSGIKTALVFTYDADQGLMVDGYFNGILGQSQIEGAFYHYWGHSGFSTRYYNSKPVTQDGFQLDPSNSIKLGSVYSQADGIAASINNINPPHDNGFYVVYAVRDYSDELGSGFTANDLIGALARIYNGVDKNQVRIVTPSQFVDLQKQYLSQRASPDWSAVLSTGGAPIPPMACVTIETTFPEGNTVDWFYWKCGGTLVSGGASPSVCPQQTTTYCGRSRNLSTGCVDWTCKCLSQPVIPFPARYDRLRTGR